MDVRQWLKKQIPETRDLTYRFALESTLNYINDLEEQLSKARKEGKASQEMLDIILEEVRQSLGPGSPFSEALAKKAQRNAARKEIKDNWRFF